MVVNKLKILKIVMWRVYEEASLRRMCKKNLYLSKKKKITIKKSDKMPCNSMKNILDLSAEEKRAFKDSFDIVFCDCDGVLWELAKPIKGSGDGANAITEAGKRLVFVTNNSINSEQDYCRKFTEIGVNVEVKNIVHPAKSVIRYFNKTNFNGLIYCVAGDAFVNALRKAGFSVITGNTKEINCYDQFLNAISDDEPVKAVVIDFDLNINYTKIARGQRYLQDPDCIFIAGATDFHVPLASEVNMLGPGYYLEMLGRATDRTPITLGKPGKELGILVQDRYKIADPKRALFIGDTLIQDIGFGKMCGFQTLVVLTGNSNLESIKNYYKEHQAPNYYANSIADFKTFFDGI